MTNQNLNEPYNRFRTVSFDPISHQMASSDCLERYSSEASESIVYRPASTQCFRHNSASSIGAPSLYRPVVAVFALEKTRSSSADIAGTERTSKAHWRREGYALACHHWKRPSFPQSRRGVRVSFI